MMKLVSIEPTHSPLHRVGLEAFFARVTTQTHALPSIQYYFVSSLSRLSLSPSLPPLSLSLSPSPLLPPLSPFPFLSAGDFPIEQAESHLDVERFVIVCARPDIAANVSIFLQNPCLPQKFIPACDRHARPFLVGGKSRLKKLSLRTTRALLAFE